MHLIVLVVFLMAMGVLSACIEWRANGVKVTNGWVIAELLSYAVVIATITTIILRFVES